MAIDQRIQTTVTAGRGSAQDSDGPIMVILLGCLAVAMCFTTLGMGLVNVASSAQAARVSANRRNPKILASMRSADDPDAALKGRQEILRKQILDLARQKESLTGQERAEKDSVDSASGRLALERAKLQQNKASLEVLNEQKQQLAARVSDLQAKVAGSSEEEQRQLELRAQLDRQLAQIRREIQQTDRRVLELRAAIVDKKNSLPLDLLRARDGKPTTWVECTRAAIVLLPQGTRVTSAELAASPAGFTQAIQRRHVEFLVRPDGFQAFHLARELAEQNGASSIGYEPVDANWRLK